ncbi:MAG: acetylglutamate kinase [Terriglobales bacterium]
MKIVVKIGGALLDRREVVEQCAATIASLVAQGNQVAVVHGGGGELTRLLKRVGKESQFVGGLRVTDAETRDFALMVLAGGVNKRLVAALAMIGQPAFGMCGGDGLAFRAKKKKGVDLGFVGEITSVNPAPLGAVWKAGAVPVIASLALGEDGEYYNVNADEMASACAAALGADRLVFLTDVNGVWDADRNVIALLDSAAVSKLRQDGVISGGMLPKLNACERALAGGVNSVHILPGADAEALRQLESGKIQMGTALVG